MSVKKDIESQIQASIDTKQAFVAGGGAVILEKMARACHKALKRGHRIYLCGNGGSAADCQHIAGEFIGRFMMDRGALPAVALTTDTSVLTCVANDYSYDQIFERQVQGLVRRGDVLMAFSTSGNSVNVNRAVEAARRAGAVTLGFSGRDGGKLRKLADLCIVAQAQPSARIQELHITAGHILCELVEKWTFA